MTDTTPAEGTEGHEHLWQRRQSVTSRGDAMPAYEVCVIPGCDRARRADRPTPPAPAAEGGAARAEAERRYPADPSAPYRTREAMLSAFTEGWVAALDAAGVPALTALLESNRRAFDRSYDAMRAAEADLDRLRAGVEAEVAECRRAADANEPLAAVGGWQASGYMHAYRVVADRLSALLAGSGEQPGEHGPACNDGLTYQDGPPYRCEGECRPAPVVPDSADVRERLAEALRAAGIASRWIGERARGRDWYDGVLVDLDEDDQMAALVDAVLAVVGQGVTAERAWREGFDLGTAHGIAYQAGNDEAWSPPPNPYRAVVRSGEQGGEG